MGTYKHIRIAGILAVAMTLCSCATVGKILNPFQESTPPEAKLGEKNDKALSEDKGKAEKAREALESMATYQRTNQPQPYNPVMQPAIVRLMWVPDHLDRYGNLIPAHYYYLKVKEEDWAVQDAFELEGQLHRKGAAGDSAVPFSYSNDVEQ